MAYYVYDGSDRFKEFESNDLATAKDIAELAIQSAKEFRHKMGFLPFWGNTIEIRIGIAGLGDCIYGEAANIEIVENSKVFKRYSVDD